MLNESPKTRIFALAMLCFGGISAMLVITFVMSVIFATPHPPGIQFIGYFGSNPNQLSVLPTSGQEPLVSQDWLTPLSIVSVCILVSALNIFLFKRRKFWLSVLVSLILLIPVGMVVFLLLNPGSISISNNPF